MADFASIEITFSDDLTTDDVITFGIGFDLSITETWAVVRDNNNKVVVADPIVDSAGERSAINFYNALLLDYANFPFTISRVVNVVTIVANKPEYQFTSPSGPVDVSFDIDNTTEATFEITDVTIEEPTVEDAATHVKVTVTTSINTKDVTSPVSLEDVDDTTFSFEIERGEAFTIVASSAGGQVAEYKNEAVSILNTSVVSTDIVFSPEGSTLTIVVENTGLTLQYSLDDITYKTENVFTGLAPGDFTLYVKDQFEVKTSIPVVVNENGINLPYAYYPKTNSIRAANRITFGDSSNYKTDENTLSCEADVPVPYRAVQLFQSGDIITTQIHSNYATNLVVVKEVTDGPIIPTYPISVTKMSNNIGQTDRRDARRYGIEAGKTGIYFTSGNIYDYVTGVDIGDYTLNGALPVWGKVGNYIKIGTGYYRINDVIYHEALEVEMLVINLISVIGISVNANVSCKYNLANFEVYQYTIDFADYLNKTVQVYTQFTDPTFGEVNYLSERINVKVRHLNTVEIKYWNKHNTDIDYSTGIKHKIRIPLEKVSGKPKDSSNIYVNDTNTILLNSEMLMVDEFEFQPMTKQFMWLVCMALLHSSVQMDGVDSVKDGSFSVEGALEETNLYILTASMIKARDAYKSDSGLEFSTGDIEIPALIGGGNDFVRYQ